MAFQSNKDLKQLLHPYIFVLKEGTEIKKNFLDYSLMMLQVTSPEIIRTPLPTGPKLSLSLKDQESVKPDLLPRAALETRLA